MKNDFELEVRAEDFLAQEAARPRFFQRLLHHSIAKRKFAAYINEGEMAIDGICGDDHALNQLMWIPFEYHAVLARAGLAFVGVAAKINGLSGILRYEAPFHARRKACAAPASEPGRLGCFDDVFRRK